MKKIFANKYVVCLISFFLFLVTALIINLFPINVIKILLATIFPIYFFIITFIYSKYNGICWDIPVLLMIIYMIVSYFALFNFISGILIVESVIFGFLSNLLLKFIDRKTKNETLNGESFFISRLSYLFNFIFPFFVAISLEIYYKICTFGTPNLKIKLGALVIAVIVIYSFYLLLLSILRNTFRANLVFSVIFTVLFVANQMRIFYTSDTLLLTDFLFLQTTGELAGMIDVTFVNAVVYVLSPTVIVIILFAYLLKICKKNNILLRNTKLNISLFALSIISLLVLLLPIKQLDMFILNKIYDYNKVSDYVISVSNTRYYYKYGVIGGMYGKLLETRRYEPDGYDEEGLKYTINNVEGIKGTWGKPNIIMVFSESFWDVTQLEGIKFDKDIIENFHKLQSRGKLVQMISPSYGGVSANVEFEILTGGSLNYFSKGYIPYMQLYNKKLSNNTPSIIKELKNNGYKNVILNSSSGSMFNCDEVYDFYGVDERMHLYDELDLNHYVSDGYLTDEVIKYFDNKEKNQKTFYFVITMGGHMPYYEERYDNYDFDIVESSYNDEINGTIKSYAEGIYKADIELGRLYEYINTLDEDTLLVFFGDHLPHLQTKKGKDALFEIGYLNNNYDLKSVYRQFNTQALILSNYDVKFDDINYLSPDLLFTYIINNMDVELSSYYKWLYTTIPLLPSSNYVLSVDKFGNLYYTLGLENEMKNTYELRKKVQYMLFR